MNSEELITVLNTIKWTKSKNRKNAMKDPNKGEYSIQFGKVFARFKGKKDSINNFKYPNVYMYLQNLASFIDPKFEYTSICVNKNFECKAHVDKNNIGTSLILGVGDYYGGELNVEGVKYDIKNQILYFDGSKQLHWVEPFSGTRYSIIWYTLK